MRLINGFPTFFRYVCCNARLPDPPSIFPSPIFRRSVVRRVWGRDYISTDLWIMLSCDPCITLCKRIQIIFITMQIILRHPEVLAPSNFNFIRELETIFRLYVIHFRMGKGGKGWMLCSRLLCAKMLRMTKAHDACQDQLLCARMYPKSSEGM